MNKPTHTPGPWRIEDDDTPWTEGDAQTAIECGEAFGDTTILFRITGLSDVLGLNPDLIALMPWEPMESSERQEELRARARLIAAAPEMRDVIAAAIKVLDAEGIVYGDTGDDTEPLDVLRDARALLARIDGGTDK